MRRVGFMVLALLVVGLATVPAGAAEMSRATIVRPAVDAPMLPFPRSERAARVWDSRACWSRCQAVCTAEQAACFKQGTEPQADCVARADSCDRACQRECRSGAGPLLPIDW